MKRARFLLLALFISQISAIIINMTKEQREQLERLKDAIGRFKWTEGSALSKFGDLEDALDEIIILLESLLDTTSLNEDERDGL